MNEKTESRSARGSPYLLLSGLVAAVVVGVAVGWLRYWLGFFVVIQGAVTGALLAWIVAALGRPAGREGGPRHPGLRASSCFAAAWLVAFLLGQLVGTGLAQPWFEPWGLLARILAGETVEPVFGIAAAGKITTGAFALSTSGFFWGLLNLLDALVMGALLMALPWEGDAPGGKRERRRRATAAGDSP